jgi:hypothetical protein
MKNPLPPHTSPDPVYEFALTPSHPTTMHSSHPIPQTTNSILPCSTIRHTNLQASQTRYKPMRIRAETTNPVHVPITHYIHITSDTYSHHRLFFNRDCFKNKIFTIHKADEDSEDEMGVEEDWALYAIPRNDVRRSGFGDICTLKYTPHFPLDTLHFTPLQMQTHTFFTPSHTITHLNSQKQHI